MNKKIIIMILQFLLIIPYSLADNTQNICLDNSTLQTTTFGIVCVASDCFNVSRVQNITCQFGCDTETATCKQQSFNIALMGLGLTFALIILGYIFMRAK